MADILAGETEHQSYAPLSQAQTLAICKHLQGEIRDVETKLLETQRDLAHTVESVDTLKGKKDGNEDAVHSLQTGLSDTNIALAKLQSEVDRNVKATQGLVISDQSNKDKIVQLDEGKKMIDTRLDVMMNDITQHRDANKRLQDDITNRVNEDMRRLNKIVENVNLSLDQMSKEQKQIVENQKDDRNQVREAHLNIENVLNEVKKGNTVTNILENRLASTAKGVQQNWTKLSELSDGATKLTECYEVTRARVIECEGQLKNLHGMGKQTHNELEDSVRQIERNADRLGQALKLLDEEGTGSEEMRHQLNSLRQSGEQASKRIAQLTKEVGEVTQSTSQLKSGLKEQNALLLPNIHLDSPEAANAAQRHGSVFGGPGGAAGSQRGTPRSAKWS